MLKNPDSYRTDETGIYYDMNAESFDPVLKFDGNGDPIYVFEEGCEIDQKIALAAILLLHSTGINKYIEKLREEIRYYRGIVKSL